VILVLLLLVGAWVSWLLLARVTLYLVSPSARVEASAAAYVIEAPVAGQVVAVQMQVGQWADAGQTLVTLATGREDASLEEQGAKLQSLEERLETLRASRELELAAVESAREEDRQDIERARAVEREARSAASYAEARLGRTRELDEKGLASKADLEEGEALAEQAEAEAEAASRELSRLQWQARLDDQRREAELAEITRQITALEGEAKMVRAAMARLDHELADRSIRTTVAGRLMEVAELRPGSVVAAGDRIAVIVPDGELQVVAHYPAHSSLGRIHPGQQARLRLDVFPWILYGELDAEVVRVGVDAASDTVRVELALEEQPSEEMVLEHGLTGTLAVAVERISPAELLLRAVGKRLGTVAVVPPGPVVRAGS
jgi:membrane fusion protein (multidrug efflux system)